MVVPKTARKIPQSYFHSGSCLFTKGCSVFSCSSRWLLFDRYRFGHLVIFAWVFLSVLWLASLFSRHRWIWLTGIEHQEWKFDAPSSLHDTSCQGKERIIQLLLDALLEQEDVSNSKSSIKMQMEELRQKWCPRLPTWSQVTDLYGSQPIILGLDTCPTRRPHTQIRRNRHTDDHLLLQPRVAGLFHTGTNALARLLEVNYGKHANLLNSTDSYRAFDVLWGKHTPLSTVDVALPETGDKNNEEVLPIVLVRDPLRWMQKMVRICCV